MEEWLHQNLPVIGAAVGAILVSVKLIKELSVVSWLKRAYISTLGKRGAQLDRIEEQMFNGSGLGIRQIIETMATDIRENKEVQRAFMDSIEVMMFRANINGDYTWVNRAYVKMMERSESEVLGKGWVNSFAGEDRSRVPHEWYKSVADGIEFKRKCLYHRPDGTEFEGTVTSRVLKDAEGRAVGFFGTIVPSATGTHVNV